jgi:hypothetical protein
MNGGLALHNEELGPPSKTTIAAAVVMSTLGFLFVVFSVIQFALANDPNAFLDEGWFVIVIGGTYDNLRSANLGFGIITLACSIYTLILARGVLKRRPGAREMARTLFAFMAMVLPLLTVMWRGILPAPKWLWIMSAVDIGVVVLLSLKPVRREFEIAKAKREDERYRKEHGLQKAGVAG